MVTNSTILTDAISLVGGMVGGLVAVVVACFRVRRLRRVPRPIERETIDPIVDARINEAAAYWAATHGKPEAQGLVASKLHLAHRLAQRQQLRGCSR
jgi:hypothetical protein